LMQRLGFTVATGGMIWLAFEHHVNDLIPCNACLLALFGAHIIAISLCIGWGRKYFSQFFTDKGEE
jgi:hypothetical protein